MNRTCFSCSYCREPKAHLKCSRCMTNRYCDSTCQRADWAKHKQTCKPCTSEYIAELAALKKDLIYPGVGDVVAAVHKHTGKTTIIFGGDDIYWLCASDVSSLVPSIVWASKSGHNPAINITAIQGDLKPLKLPEIPHNYFFRVSEEGIEIIPKE